MKFIEILKPKNWTRLNTGDREETDDLRRDVLFSQIMVVGFAIAILHFINDFINGNSFVYVIDILFILSLAFFYYLNEKGAHQIAKFLDLTALNFMIFLLASIMDEYVRMEYNFFPLAILASANVPVKWSRCSPLRSPRPSAPRPMHSTTKNRTSQSMSDLEQRSTISNSCELSSTPAIAATSVLNTKAESWTNMPASGPRKSCSSAFANN